jgi:hypothetical protein
MLARVHQRLRKLACVLRHLPHDRRDFHVVRPCADDMQNAFQACQLRCLESGYCPTTRTVAR